MNDRRARPKSRAIDESAVHEISSKVERPQSQEEGSAFSTEELETALFHERHLLDSLLTNLPDAIYFKDARGTFIRVNPAMAKRLGLADPGDACGKTASDVPNAAAALALHRDDEVVLRTGEAQGYRLERFDRPSEGVEWALVTRLPIRARDGTIAGVIGVFHDVTEQRRAEDRIREAVVRRDQFLAMLSHELRNPLAAIVTASSLLKREFPTSEPRPLSILQRQALQMARLLDDLLEVNRVTENRIELRRKVVDLRTVARDAADASRAWMNESRLSFTLTLGDEPVWVDGDPARLHQVQTNLLHNASKYTPAGGHVTLAVAGDGHRAILRVRDDGAGLPREMLETVFEVFAQTGRTLDRAKGGIGLGLTVVRSLVEMHGGSVVALSDGEGKGSEFVVSLPVANPPESSEAAEAPHQERPRLPTHAKIAIIEDNSDCRDMLYTALSVAGFQCQAADNGVDGLALIEAVQPDVAIIDVGLPAMNGFELARRIRAEPKNASVRLVALTGYGMREDRERALAAGFDDHLVKPIEPGTLLDYIKGGTN